MGREHPASLPTCPPAHLLDSRLMASVIPCRTFRRHFSAWRDGVASIADEAMREHLTACGRCHALSRALDVGVRVLRHSELAWPTSPSKHSTAR